MRCRHESRVLENIPVVLFVVTCWRSPWFPRWNATTDVESQVMLLLTAVMDGINETSLRLTTDQANLTHVSITIWRRIMTQILHTNRILIFHIFPESVFCWRTRMMKFSSGATRTS